MKDVAGDDSGPTFWLGHSVRTTMLTSDDSFLSLAPHTLSLGDAVHRPRLLDRVFIKGLKQRVGISGPLMLDSGGYTSMVHGGGIDIKVVTRIYRRVDADLVVSLDLPTIREEPAKERRVKHRTTLANLRKLVGEIEPRRIIPVVHGPTLDEIKRNSEAIARIAPHARYVAIGGIVPLLRRSGNKSRVLRPEPGGVFFARAIQAVREANRAARIHVLGAGSPTAVLGLLALGVDSVDSIGWRRAAGFGTIFVPGLGERFPQASSRRRNSRPVVGDRERALLQTCTCPPCKAHASLDARLAMFGGRDYVPRAIHNAWTMLQECRALRAARLRGQAEKFLGDRFPPKWLLGNSPDR